jgi:hypothetical protein
MKRTLWLSQTRRKVCAARSISRRGKDFSRSWTMSTPPRSAAASSASGSSPRGRASQQK